MLAFAAPWFLLGLLLVPVVLVLHFVRRARRERTVSAVWLWPGEEAPSKRARFSPTVLLLLQLLTVIAASVGAAGPRFETPGRDLAIIVDASASMTATDVAPTRLAAAKLEAERLLAGARQVVIVRAGLTATLEQPPTADRGAASKALAALNAGDSSADLENALRLARTLLPKAEVHLLTGLEAPEGFQGVLHTVRGDGRNVGITAFTVRGAQMFAALESNERAPKTVTLTLERDGVELGRTNLRVPAGGRAVWTPTAIPQSGEYRVQIQSAFASDAATGSGDALALDDTAVAVVSTGRVLVSPAQDDVLKATSSVPGVRAVTQSLPPASSRGFDALVLVGSLPRRLLPGQYLLFAPLPGNPPKGQQPAPPVTVTGWDAAAPELRFASLEGVRARISALAPPEIPGGSWTPIAWAAAKPLIWRGEGPGVQAMYIAAHPLESDLRSSPAFPVMLYNLLSEFIGVASRPLGSRLPQGARLEGQGNRALEPGLYAGDDARFVANLGSSEQTRLRNGTTSTQRIGAAAQNPERISTAPPSESPWRAGLLLLALIALALEALLRGRALERFGWRGAA